MGRTIKLFAIYLASMIVGAYFGFCSYMFGLLGEAASKAGDGHAWLWNLESSLAALIGIVLFVGPIVYDIFIEQERNMVNGKQKRSEHDARISASRFQ